MHACSIFYLCVFIMSYHQTDNEQFVCTNIHCSYCGILILHYTEAHPEHGSQHHMQGCIGGYTRVYAVYQPPVYFAGVYSPQLLYIKGYTRVIRRAGWHMCVQTIPRQDKSVADSDSNLCHLSETETWVLRCIQIQQSARVCVIYSLVTIATCRKYVVLTS